MIKLIGKLLFESSEFHKIVLVVFPFCMLQVFGCTRSLDDLTFRLPLDVRPVSYVLQLYPDFDTETFHGEVTIAIEVMCQSRYIVLHAKDLTIEDTRISLIKQSDETLIVIDDLVLKRISMIHELDMILVETRRNILPGTYEIRMKFNGTMSNTNRGLFMTSYTDPETGFTRKIAATQFHPTHARRAFPCFDEPGFKAIFNIQLIQSNIDGYHALSNMPIEISLSGVPLPGLKTVYFEPSLPMSTYLVTFVISSFVNKTTSVYNLWDNTRQIPVRAWTTVDKLFTSDLVLFTVYHAIDIYMSLFGVDCPIPKIDMVAVPNALVSNENWGLNTLDESTMLYYDRLNSITELKISANRITNELVHVWFGNLVTVEWWSDFWLIESFATYMQYYTTDAIFLEWKESEHFLVDAKYPSMMHDSLMSAEPIVQLCDSVEKIEHIFDEMPDKKGASIIRMLHYMMGERNFFRGVASYLQRYEYRATVADDFLNCLQEYYTREEDLVRLVHTWTKQSGFPVLNVVRIGNVYFINQTRYFMNNAVDYKPTCSPYSFKWDLPIFYITSSNNWPKRTFMSYDTKEVTLRVKEDVRWVKFNTNSVGYYTVNYDSRSWDILSIILRTQPEKFGMLDRTDLLNDAFVNADADAIPYDVPMVMLTYIKYETEYTPWQMACEKLLKIHTMLRNTLVRGKFEVFVRNLIKPIYETTGWRIHPIDSFELRRLRMIILKTACVFGVNDCLVEVTRRFREWMDNPNTRPHPDIKYIIYYYGMMIAGTQSDWEIVYDLFMVEKNLQERQKLMICLTAVQNSSLLLTYLQVAKNLNVMKPNEYLETIRAATMSPIGPRIIWDFYRRNWEFFKSRYSRNDGEFARLIIQVTSNFRASYRHTELESFFKTYPHGAFHEAARKEALEIVRNNALWLQRNYMEIKNWLETYYLGHAAP